jgi:hypothetical protein
MALIHNIQLVYECTVKNNHFYYQCCKTKWKHGKLIYLILYVKSNIMSVYTLQSCLPTFIIIK